MSRRYDISEQENYIKQVEELVNEGRTQVQALKELGISQTAYYNWKRQLKSRKAQVNNERSENNSYKQKYAELICEYNSLKNYVRRLEEKLGSILIKRELSQ